MSGKAARPTLASRTCPIRGLPTRTNAPRSISACSSTSRIGSRLRSTSRSTIRNIMSPSPLPGRRRSASKMRRPAARRCSTHPRICRPILPTSSTRWARMSCNCRPIWRRRCAACRARSTSNAIMPSPARSRIQPQKQPRRTMPRRRSERPLPWARSSRSRLAGRRANSASGCPSRGSLPGSLPSKNSSTSC